MVRATWFRGVLLGAVLATSSIIPAGADPNLPFTNDAVDQIKMTGSPVTSQLINDLAIAYMESAGCSSTDATFPLTATSPTQNRCKEPAAQTGSVTTENYDHDTLVPYYPNDKSGLRQLCAQRISPPRDPRVAYVDLVHTLSRPQTAATNVSPNDGFKCTVAAGTQAGTVLRFVAFARDGMSWVRWVGGSRPNIASLRQYELFDIFVSCYITHWNQLQTTYDGSFYPAPAGELIRVFTASPISEERAMWDGFLGGDSDNCIPNHLRDGDLSDGERVVPANDVRWVEEAPNDPAAANQGNSMFFFSVARHTHGPATLRGASILGSLDTSDNASISPVAPTEPNIASGLFPYSRFVYLVYRNSGPSPIASSATRRFAQMSNNSNDQAIGWICKPDAAHAEPLGTAGPGIEFATADIDYGLVVPGTIRNNGFVPLAPDALGRTCRFADVAVS